MTNVFESKDTFIPFFIEQALQEDVGSGDHTSQACIPADDRTSARLYVKDAGVLAGVELAQRFFQAVDPSAQFRALLADGADVSFGQVAFEVECNTRALLRVERALLNSMQRMSGIATLSNRYHFEVEDLPVKIL
ncbi:MAG: nicotinate-nucleotide diphosphorylase (carboxylating), partial [Saprospiraceae bacterium]|nr:nicotinate-nucleotide diphosphorylase (carboxylating) [Saprospiraceae bacterium]